ncbi:MAG TPA: hypothetical protein VF432_25720 [Thermoanaerobaculia bacterium]
MPPLIEKRVTKYDPARRNAAGQYLSEEWTSFGDVGTSVTLEEYQQFETGYITAALELLRGSGLSGLRVAGLENPANHAIPFDEGTWLTLDALEEAFRLVLREQIWCRFEDDSGAFVHFGWDYSMYVGVTRTTPRAIAAAERLGLFVEDFPSPYRETAR